MVKALKFAVIIALPDTLSIVFAANVFDTLAALLLSQLEKMKLPKVNAFIG